MRPQRRALEEMGLALLCLAAAFASGCAYVDVRPDGTRRVVGLVYLELPAAGSANEVGGETLRMRSLGMGYASAGHAATFALGYFDSSHTVINNNSCIALTGGFAPRR